MKNTKFISYIAVFLALMQSNLIFSKQLSNSSEALTLKMSKEPITQKTILKFASPTTYQQNRPTQKISINNTKMPKMRASNKSLAEKLLSPKEESETDHEIYQALKMASEITGIIEKKAFKKPNFISFFEESFKAGVPFCDPHSAFFTKKSYTETIDSTSGEFGGIGISTISKDITDEWLLVTDVIEGKPADKAGVKSGDKIVDVNGEKLKGLSSDEVIAKLKGPQGSVVKIKIIRNNKLLDKDFEIKRDIIKTEVATCYQLKDFNIYYISLRIFSENAAESSIKCFKKACDDKNCNGIIFDLRRNPGGILDIAIDMAGLFVKKDSMVVSTKDRDGKVVSEYKTNKDPIYNNKIPLIILIDNFSASASEILAGALKHYSNDDKTSNPLITFLVGTQTFGKGSVQEVIPISNGCAIKLTTMLYYLPDGSSIQAKGIEPDFIIKSKITPEEESHFFTAFYGSESSLKNNITPEEAAGKKVDKTKKLKEKIEKTEENLSWEEKFKKSLNNDMQIKSAINIINVLSLAKKMDAKQINTRSNAIKFLKTHLATDDLIDIKKVKD